MSAQTPETIPDVDELLAKLSAGWHAQRALGNDLEAERIALFIDKALDIRLALDAA